MENYLLLLNPSHDGFEVWLPKISDETLARLRKSGNRVYIAHDWFSQGNYEYGLYTIIDGKIRNLKYHPNARIVNSDEKFIFESNSLIGSHKGLVAIEVFEDIGSPIFVMERNFYAEKMPACASLWFGAERKTTSASLWFEYGTPKSLKNKIIKLVKNLDSSCFVDYNKEAFISINAEDYDRMLQQLPVQLI